MRSLISSLVKLSKTVKIFGLRTLSSSSGKLTSLDVNDKTGVAVLTLNRPPVNALNLEMLTEISNALTILEDNHSKGLIITSTSSKVFSAGVDILELVKSNPQRKRQFWITFQDMWIKLYGSGYPTSAAISGYSPGAGCFLALNCEYRVMVPKFKIGLNETQLGAVAPKWFMTSMKNVLPTRIAESALVAGTLFTTDEALKVGLIDEIANDKVDAIAKCEKYIAKFSKISPNARNLTKQSLRSKNLRNFKDSRDQDMQEILSFYNDPKVQKGLEIFMENLKKKSK